MRKLPLFRIALFAVFAVLFGAQAHAQTPQQIQALISSGQEKTALSELTTVIQAHPDSGVAWYLTAEAQDASNNLGAARSALAKADQYAPGLPFAKPDKVAALRAHLAQPAAAQGGSGISGTVIVIGVLIVLFILFRMFIRSRRRMGPPGYQPGYGPNPGMGGPFQSGPMGGMNYGQGGGMPGAGSSIISGLAAGAGFAAGERLFDGLTGSGRNDRAIDPASNIDPSPVPDRDDGLNGTPDWNNDNSSSNDDDNNIDPGNNW